MIRRSLLAAAVLAAFTLPAGVQAQSIDSPYRFVETTHGFRVEAGYLFTDRGVLGAGPASGPLVGAGYNIRVSGPFEFDTRAAFVPTTRTVFDTEPTDSAELRANPRAGLDRLGTADISLLLLDATLRFDVTGPRTFFGIQPYALIGAGGVFRVGSNNAAEEALAEDSNLRVRFGNGFTGHIGAGLEWYPGRRLTVRLDARDLLWRIDLPDGFQEPGRVIDTSEWVQNAALSLGLVLRI